MLWEVGEDDPIRKRAEDGLTSYLVASDVSISRTIKKHWRVMTNYEDNTESVTHEMLQSASAACLGDAFDEMTKTLPDRMGLMPDRPDYDWKLIKQNYIEYMKDLWVMYASLKSMAARAEELGVKRTDTKGGCIQLMTNSWMEYLKKTDAVARIVASEIVIGCKESLENYKDVDLGDETGETGEDESEGEAEDEGEGEGEGETEGEGEGEADDDSDTESIASSMNDVAIMTFAEARVVLGLDDEFKTESLKRKLQEELEGLEIEDKAFGSNVSDVTALGERLSKCRRVSAAIEAAAGPSNERSSAE